MISGKDRRVGVGLTGLLLLVLGPFNAWANDDAVETAHLLAVLLDSGRVTVGMNQELINDPSKGYKGFTPEMFENQVIAVFKQRTGVDLATIDRATVPDVAKLLLSRLLEESKKTIASYQTVINLAGLKYKGLIPATFGTETAHRFENWSGVYLKQTAPERLLRNPKNKPDAYEAVVLQRFAASGYASENNSVFSELLRRDGPSVSCCRCITARRALAVTGSRRENETSRGILGKAERKGNWVVRSASSCRFGNDLPRLRSGFHCPRTLV